MFVQDGFLYLIVTKHKLTVLSTEMTSCLSPSRTVKVLGPLVITS
jgi:hypothetical protein